MVLLVTISPIARWTRTYRFTKLRIVGMDKWNACRNGCIDGGKHRLFIYVSDGEASVTLSQQEPCIAEPVFGHDLIWNSKVLRWILVEMSPRKLWDLDPLKRSTLGASDVNLRGRRAGSVEDGAGVESEFK